MEIGHVIRTGAVCLLACGLAVTHVTAGPEKDVALTPLGTYASGVFNGTEIAAYDAKTERLFTTNVAAGKIDILSISNPAAPSKVGEIDLAAYGVFANGVAVHKGLVAVAVQATTKTDNGKVVFFDTTGAFLSVVTVGAQPDMLTFTPDGKRVLTANEGEPNQYTAPGNVDPEGSVSIIDLSHSHGATTLSQTDVTTAGFAAFNAPAILDTSIRIFGPGATVAQDLEPEYVAVSDDSKTAWVTLQENNAIAELDITSGVFTRLFGLGLKDHSALDAGIDGSDQDGVGSAKKINIARWPVQGMYLPDAVAAYKVGGREYLVTANEGDEREWAGLTESARLSSRTLNATVFTNQAPLKTDDVDGISRLTVSTIGADTDAGVAGIERILSYGARSFSIWTDDGVQVFDSGDAFEQIIADLPDSAQSFNSDNVFGTTFDTRSDNKGPEPEGVAIEKLWGRWYAFVTLERVGGVMVYDITDPYQARFVQYVNNRTFVLGGGTGDLGPEGIFVIPGSDSPTHKPLLVVANEVSGTTTVFAIDKLK